MALDLSGSSIKTTSLPSLATSGEASVSPSRACPDAKRGALAHAIMRGMIRLMAALPLLTSAGELLPGDSVPGGSSMAKKPPAPDGDGSPRPLPKTSSGIGQPAAAGRRTPPDTTGGKIRKARGQEAAQEDQAAAIT